MLFSVGKKNPSESLIVFNCTAVLLNQVWYFHGTCPKVCQKRWKFGRQSRGRYKKDDEEEKAKKNTWGSFS